MNRYRNVLVTMVALALVGILTGATSAQRAVVNDGHFTPLFKAKWADQVLSPGDYTLSVTRLSGGYLKYAVTFSGAGTKHTLLALSPLGPRVGQRTMLVAEYNGWIYSIRALHLPNADLLLTFPAPGREESFVAKTPEATQLVPILIAAKERTGY